MTHHMTTPALPTPAHVKVGNATGELHFPYGTGTPWPGVVILNSSAGVCDTRERFYARFLAARGIAALVVDSFTSRGIGQTTADQSLFDDMDMERDAYAAHDLLAADPRIALGNIAVMGVSKGGLAALNTALLVRRHMFDRPRHDFSARVVIVPPAHLQHRDARTDGRPMLMLLAGHDDYTGVAGPVEYARRMIAAGNPGIKVRVHEGAHHAFERTGPPLYLPGAENFSHRLFMVEDDGSITDEAGHHMGPQAFSASRRTYVVLGAHAGGGTDELKETVATEILHFLVAAAR
ncbi:MAG: dienelactone hydrolase family protein [Desulfovibrio sp.]|jgi:dienelactone hydrolase|nr:dienelactone hydrolase family protein [Desulfovibrio sp.]